jgi:hypothetical protein
MQIDKEKLQKFLNLSDDDFKKKVTEVVTSSGLDKKDKENLDKALKNVKEIKKTLGNIDEESLKKAVNSLGIEKIEELMKNLKN